MGEIGTITKFEGMRHSYREIARLRLQRNWRMHGSVHIKIEGKSKYAKRESVVANPLQGFVSGIRHVVSYALGAGRQYHIVPRLLPARCDFAGHKQAIKFDS